MGYPQSLSLLATREEIADTIVRPCLGLDSNNKALWESAWAMDPDITLDINDNIMKGLENIQEPLRRYWPNGHLAPALQHSH
jgi:hypothetical protein